MNENKPSEIDNLVAYVQNKKKYAHIHTGLIRAIAQSEWDKGRKRKETEKAILGKLHQIGSAYFAQRPDYATWENELESLPNDLQSEATRAYCIRIMQNHHSTSERLYILQNFYQEVLASIQPISSILDLACGLNPLTLPWMPVKNDVRYYGCDIFSDMITYLNSFASHFNIQASFHTCNILDADFTQKAKVAFVLKTLPCLEQIEKNFASNLLERIPAEYILVSYPISSLSGKAKGMRETYTTQFESLMANYRWPYQKFEFSSELAFLVNKG